MLLRTLRQTGAQRRRPKSGCCAAIATGVRNIIGRNRGARQRAGNVRGGAGSGCRVMFGTEWNWFRRRWLKAVESGRVWMGSGGRNLGGRAYLVGKLRERGVSRRDAVRILNVIFGEMGLALRRGEYVEFPFGYLMPEKRVSQRWEARGRRADAALLHRALAR